MTLQVCFFYCIEKKKPKNWSINTDWEGIHVNLLIVKRSAHLNHAKKSSKTIKMRTVANKKNGPPPTYSLKIRFFLISKLKNNLNPMCVKYQPML